MADLNIPKLNKKSDKYIFKKKLSLKRKSKIRLISESAFFFILSLSLVYINNLIPNKNLIIQDFPKTLNKSLILIIDLFSNLFEIIFVFLIFVSYLVALILMIGSLNRLFRVIKRIFKKYL